MTLNAILKLHKEKHGLEGALYSHLCLIYYLLLLPSIDKLAKHYILLTSEKMFFPH
jgi:hypothetical protein